MPGPDGARSRPRHHRARRPRRIGCPRPCSSTEPDRPRPPAILRGAARPRRRAADECAGGGPAP